MIQIFCHNQLSKMSLEVLIPFNIHKDTNLMKGDLSMLLWLCCAIFIILGETTTNALYVDVPPSLKTRQQSRSPFTLLKSSLNGGKGSSSKPVLVVGATGKVGKLVVQKLLDENVAVRALVRNETKATEIFAEQLSATNKLELVVSDLGKVDEASLDAAVQGCESIVSVSGAFRFSKLSDFLPWRIFPFDVSSWCGDDTSHPYFVNYQANKILIDLAAKYECSRFVRLTGLSTGYSPFNLVSMIFSSLGSLSTRYHFATEQYLRNSKVPYVILRPGGLAEEERDVATTNLQLDSSGVLPPPGRVPRADVAAVAALAVSDPTTLDPSKSYTLGVRAVGDMKPKPQGTKEEGLPTALECLKSIREQEDTIDKTVVTKPYGVAVAMFVYTFAFLGFQLASTILGTILRLLPF